MTRASVRHRRHCIWFTHLGLVFEPHLTYFHAVGLDEVGPRRVHDLHIFALAALYAVRFDQRAALQDTP